MTRSVLSNNLSASLDRIWMTQESPYSVAQQCLSKLSESDWLLLAGWDVAATYGPVKGIGSTLQFDPPHTASVTDASGHTIVSGRLQHDGRAKELQSRGAIQYSTSGYAFVLDHSDEDVPEGTTLHDPAALLAGMQWIRDHLNSTLLKSVDFREQELDSASRSARLTPNHFRRLAAWFPEVEKLLRVKAS